MPPQLWSNTYLCDYFVWCCVLGLRCLTHMRMSHICGSAAASHRAHHGWFTSRQINLVICVLNWFLLTIWWVSVSIEFQKFGALKLYAFLPVTVFMFATSIWFVFTLLVVLALLLSLCLKNLCKPASLMFIFVWQTSFKWIYWLWGSFYWWV